MYDQEKCLYNFHENSKMEKIEHYPTLNKTNWKGYLYYLSCDPFPKSLSAVRDEGKQF